MWTSSSEGSMAQSCAGSWNVAGSNIRRSKDGVNRHWSEASGTMLLNVCRRDLQNRRLLMCLRTRLSCGPNWTRSATKLRITAINLRRFQRGKTGQPRPPTSCRQTSVSYSRRFAMWPPSWGQSWMRRRLRWKNSTRNSTSFLRSTTKLHSLLSSCRLLSTIYSRRFFFNFCS